MIHSSPFLRCVQSSIAISAGIAQYQGNLKKFEAAQSRGALRSGRASNPPTRSHTLDATALDARYDREDRQPHPKEPQPAPDSDNDIGFWKPTLRIDAFLGEWLSPTYYEFTTPPPSSNMMVAGAKADLMRPASPIQGSRLPADLPQSSVHGQESGRTDAHHKRVNSVSFDLPELADALPSLEDHSSLASPGERPSTSGSMRARHKSVSNGYVPPAPNYAISGSEPIPAGYVAHARQACIRLDFQWDSMREPQNWGDGGEHGEEWAAMHTRFRRGFMEMISWYKTQSLYFDPQEDAETGDANGRELEEDEDLILILVTHSAGCNALIGAITNHPVLLDVGMGSLTMAIHKGPAYATSSTMPQRKSSVTGRRRSSVDCSQSQEYEMKIVASMEHLRAGADPLRIPQLMSPHLTAIPENGRRRDTLSSISDGTLTPELEAPSNRSSALGSILRNRSTTMGSSRSATSEPNRSGSGLWGSRASTLVEPTYTAPSRDNSGTFDGNDSQDELSTPSSMASVQAGVNRSNSQRGLWGGGSRKEPTRRWTLTEHRS